MAGEIATPGSMMPRLPGAAPALPGAQGAPAIPSGPTAPASVSTVNLGLHAKGLTILTIVTKALEQAVPMLDTSTDAGQAALDALKKISKYATASPELTRQELKTLDAQAPAIPPAPTDSAQARIAQLGLGQPAAA